MILSVASVDASQNLKDVADYVCDGTADDVEIQAALDAVANEKISYGANGGTVVLLGRKFNVTKNIGVPTQTVLDVNDAWLFAQKWTGFTGEQAGVVQLKTTGTQYAQVKNANINVGNVDVCGIYIGVAAAQEWDAFIRLENIFIVNAGTHGARWDNLSGGRCRGNMASRIRVLNSKLSNFYINCPDSFFEFLDSGSAGSHGIMVMHSNNRFVGCKSWFSDGSGWYFKNGRDNQLSACESQDNQNHGYELSSPRNILSSCLADSNGYNGVKTPGQPTNLGSGFYVTAPGNNIQGNASDKNESNRGVRQEWALKIVGNVPTIAQVVAYNNVNQGMSAPSLKDTTTVKVVQV